MGLGQCEVCSLCSHCTSIIQQVWQMMPHWIQSNCIQCFMEIKSRSTICWCWQNVLHTTRDFHFAWSNVQSLSPVTLLHLLKTVYLSKNLRACKLLKQKICSKLPPSLIASCTLSLREGLSPWGCKCKETLLISIGLAKRRSIWSQHLSNNAGHLYTTTYKVRKRKEKIRDSKQDSQTNIVNALLTTMLFKCCS